MIIKISQSLRSFEMTRLILKSSTSRTDSAIVNSDFLMWAVFSRVILEMGMTLFFVKMEKIQDS
ncbi:hypothetical protein DS62_03875 [Smithella sp. SC_K08D17]|nr:hypothetical protein DS62_03875 [Smithella sp. SC_K08D17]